MQSRAQSWTWLLTFLVTTAGLVVATLSGGKAEAWIATGVVALVSLISLVSSSFVRVLLESLRNPREATRIEHVEGDAGRQWVLRAEPPAAESPPAESAAPHAHDEEAE